MGFLDTLRSMLFPQIGAGAGPLEEGRVLDVPSGTNFRDLGGYDTPSGPTQYHRFIRSGSTAYLTDADLTRLEIYGVSRVLDLRSSFESPRSSDRFARRADVDWLNVPLFDYDLSDPNLSGVAVPDGNYLIEGYVTMLSNKLAMRSIFEYFAATPPGKGVLFHCAAGMDRTGMTAMLLLGLAEVPRAQIVADYLYSFAPVAKVNRVVFDHEQPEVRADMWNPFPTRMEAINFMLDRLEGGYGTARAYLESCGLDNATIEAVRVMLAPQAAAEPVETDSST